MSSTEPFSRQKRDAPQPPDARLAPFLGFWSSIFEEETLRPDPPLHFTEQPRRFCALPLLQETLLSAGAAKQPVNPSDNALRIFFTPPPPDRMTYGWPVSLDPKGRISPLFFQTVQVVVESGVWNLVPADKRGVRINPGPLRALGFDDGVVAGLVKRLEEGSGSFLERVAFAGKYLGFDPATLDPKALGAWPAGPEEGRTIWINRPILVAAPRRRNEIAELAQPDRLQAIARTALGPYSAPQPPKRKGKFQEDHLSGPTVVEVHRLGPSQTQAVRSAMENVLTVTAAPPGSGKLPTMINLAVTTLMNGQSVLYVNPTAENARQFSLQLDALVDKQHPWTLKLGLGQDLQTVREQMFKMLSAVAKEEKEKANQEKAQAAAGGGGGGKKNSGRDRPTLRMLAEFDLAADETRDQLEPARQALDRLRPLQHKRLQVTADFGKHWLEAVAKKKKILTPPDKLRQAREECAVLAGRSSQSFGGMMKSMVTFGNKLAPIFEVLRSASNSLTPEARDEVMEGLDKDSDPTKVLKAFDKLLKYDGLLQQIQKEADLLTEMRKKFKDAEYLNGRLDFALGQKVAGARELVGDFWKDLVLGNLPKAGRFALIYFDLMKKRPQAFQDGSIGVIDADLGIAIREVATCYPVWCMPVSQVSTYLPLQPALFDLIIIDEAHKLDVSQVLPLLFRAKRALLIGAGRRETRLTSISDATVKEFAQAYVGASPQPLDPKQNPIGYGRSAVEQAGFKLRVLNDHFRSHPQIADFVNRSFYDGKLAVFTNFRKLQEGIGQDYLGMRWYETPGKIAADRGGIFNEAEIERAIGLMKGWEADGLFKLVPRRSIGVVSPFPAEIARLKVQIAKQNFPEPVLQRLTVGLPRDFRGQQVDLLILLPGICNGIPAGMTTVIAKSEFLFHDAVSSTRCGIHVLGEAASCRAAGGFLAALEGAATQGRDWFVTPDGAVVKPRLALSGTVQEPTRDIRKELAKLLDQLKLCHQSDVLVGKYRLQTRVFSPFGVPYAIDIDALQSSGKDDVHEAMEAIVSRDEELLEQGYRVLHLGSEDVLSAPRDVIELVKRLV